MCQALPSIGPGTQQALYAQAVTIRPIYFEGLGDEELGRAPNVLDYEIKNLKRLLTGNINKI